MEHNQLESASPSSGRKAASISSDRPAAPTRDPRLEAYLTRVVERLPRQMSPAARAAERQELAAHLDALVAAHLELGRDEETAVLSALQEFGDAKQLGRQLARSIKRGKRPNVPSSVHWCGACEFFLCGLILFGFRDYPSLSLGSQPSGLFFDMLIPTLAGFAWGYWRPVGRRWLGMVVAPLALACLLLPMSPEAPNGVGLMLGAYALLFAKWAMVASTIAGLTVSIGLLRAENKKLSA
jgi:hypothetical protein